MASNAPAINPKLDYRYIDDLTRWWLIQQDIVANITISSPSQPGEELTAPMPLLQPPTLLE